jgi:methylmalonyl-CoA/ethylmalonyl-CoA epimerase
MTLPEIEIDHIAIAVPKLGINDGFWKALGFSPDPHPEVVADQKVKVGMLEFKNQARIELLEPTDETSTVAHFLKKRGPGLHHICLRVKNIETVLKNLKASNIRLINETPVNGAHGCKVAFVHPSSTGGVLIELSERGVEN